MDFMHDRLSDGRSFRLFNMPDDFNRGGLGSGIDLSLEQIIEWRGQPKVIRGNGPEYISGALLSGAERQDRHRAHPAGKSCRKTPTSSTITGLFATLGRSRPCSTQSAVAGQGHRPQAGYGRTATSAPRWHLVALLRR